MQFELWSGEEIFLPVELVDCLDRTLLQEGLISAVGLLCQQCPPDISDRLRLRTAIRILMARQEWLRTSATSKLSPYGTHTDAV